MQSQYTSILAHAGRVGRLLMLVAGLALAGCAGLTREHGRDTQGVSVVEHYLAALNRRDLLMLTAYVTPDVEWYSMVDGKPILEVSGRAALAKTLQVYFDQNRFVHWSDDAVIEHDRYVAVRERSQWRGNGEAKIGERVTLCVYELYDGRIRRITHYLDAAQ